MYILTFSNNRKLNVPDIQANYGKDNLHMSEDPKLLLRIFSNRNPLANEQFNGLQSVVEYCFHFVTSFSLFPLMATTATFSTVTTALAAVTVTADSGFNVVSPHPVPVISYLMKSERYCFNLLYNCLL